MRQHGIGSIKIRIPLSTSHFIKIKSDVVDVDIPFLLGLKKFTELEALLDIGNRRFASHAAGLIISLANQLGHL